jgi:two-component system LytT family response regulator
MNLRVLIAEDEPLSRERLRQLLHDEPDIEVVAECATGREALATIRDAQPDLVFLDVRMPELDGFSVIDSLDGERIPAVVFVTAHDQFAVRAFDVEAVDYLLKPFDRARFRAALRRARTRVEAGISPQRPAARLGSLAGCIQCLHRVAVKSEGRISLINIDEIDWICAADNYTQLYVAKTCHFLRKTISALAEQLPKNRFLRISRSHVVNLERVKEIRPKSHGDYTVVLRDGTTLPATRTFRHNLAPLFGRRV